MPDATTKPSAGDRVGNYEILGLAGSGGMGVVYRALDLKLQRTVALKFLPDELVAAKADKDRFLREARTASSLDHPNIGVIHGIEETSDGRSFIVMAYYEGETLAQKISRRRLALPEAVDIALQMAIGLAEAHARTVVHRDIKPSNVIITPQNVAKIVDFGLARATTTTVSTQTMGTSGTIGYMSPEQTLGKVVDQRTDIWALGVVIAEMVTGRNPFHRDSAPAAIVAILNEPPKLGTKYHWSCSASFIEHSPKMLRPGITLAARSWRTWKASAVIWSQAGKRRVHKRLGPPALPQDSEKRCNALPARCCCRALLHDRRGSGGWLQLGSPLSFCLF